MAQLKDTVITGDALIQGDIQVNGEINHKTIDIDSNCKIIEFCKRLDLSAVNNEVQITLPDGYVCNPTAPTSAQVGIDTCDGKTGAWTTDATVEFSTIHAQGGSTYTNSRTISHGSLANMGLIPFCKTYIKAKVTTAAVGTNPYVTLFGTIYCKKL
jgi:hypothetical protein